MAAADEIGVLALPAEAGGFGQRLFHNRCRIDEDFQILARGAGGETAGDALELAFDNVVIIAVLCIDGNRGLILVLEDCQRIAVRSVIHGKHDDRTHLRPQVVRTGAAFFRFLHPVHAGVASERQIVAQALFG